MADTGRRRRRRDQVDVGRSVEDIDLICIHTGISRSEACRQIGIPPQMLSDMDSVARVPAAATIERIRAWLRPGHPTYLVPAGEGEAA
jgi:hypothetical protein